jgi:hypothetical protein
MAMDVPTYGYDLAGADAYAQVIAAQTGLNQYNYCIAWCATKGALISLDGGTTDHFRIDPDASPIPLKVTFSPRAGAVHAKNCDSGQNYAALHVIIGYEHR